MQSNSRFSHQKFAYPILFSTSEAPCPLQVVNGCIKLTYMRRSMSPIEEIPRHRVFLPGSWGGAPSALAAIVFLVLVSCAPEPRPAGPTANEEKRVKIEAMYEEFRPDFPDAEEIDVKEFLKLRARGEVLLVDVREDYERAVSIIPGAMSKESFEEIRNDLADVPVVVHCTIGYRSARYVESLRDQGVDAYNLKGSILSWVHAGQPVVDLEGNEMKRVHVYGKRWDLLPEGYEAVW